MMQEALCYSTSKRTVSAEKEDSSIPDHSLHQDNRYD